MIGLLTTLISVSALIKLDTSSTESICSAASTVAKGLLDYYDGTNEDGQLGYFNGDYYWWEYSQLFHSLIDYTYYCNDDQYESLLVEGIESQLGSQNNFIPSLQKANIGNDDQTFWGLLALNAHMKNLPEPSELTWLDAAKNVFDEVHERWDPDTCSGGIRWQILESKQGYSYKNSISNGNLFLMATQLYDITKEQKYYTIAEKIWKWVTDVGFVSKNGDGIMSVNDGAEIDDDCLKLTKLEWSYNYGTYLGGTSTLYHQSLLQNSTLKHNWQNSSSEIFIGVETFFNDDDILYERTCQLTNTCNEDERCFKSILIRNMVTLSQYVPKLRESIEDYLDSSAQAAARTCSGGSDGVTCGLNWFKDDWDGKYGIGEQMNSLLILISLLA